jgi:exopolysaccharide production protein ExoZ
LREVLPHIFLKVISSFHGSFNPLKRNVRRLDRLNNVFSNLRIARHEAGFLPLDCSAAPRAPDHPTILSAISQIASARPALAACANAGRWRKSSASAMNDVVFNVQCLRAVAAMLVVAHHLQAMVNANYDTNWMGRFGTFGVDIFFVISGFIMFYTNRTMRRGAGEFISNRLLRIIPLYWLATLVTVVLFLIGFHPNGLHQVDLPRFIESLVFVPGEFPDGRTDLILTLGWTLMYELYFYAVFAATFFVRSLEKSLAIVTLFFIGGTGLAITFGPFNYLVDYYLNPITLEFVFGAILAILYVRWPSKSSGWGALLAATLIAGGFGLAEIANKFADPTVSNIRFVYFGVPASLIVAGCLLLEKSGRRFTNSFALLLGAASYSLYLFHPIFLQASVKAVRVISHSPRDLSLYCAVAAALVIALTGAILIHLLVEKRIMGLKVRYVRAFHDGIIRWPPLARRTAAGQATQSKGLAEG